MSENNDKKYVVTFAPEKSTKNTIRFKEVLETDLDTAIIGTLYVQKLALKALEYDGVSNIEVTLTSVK